MKKRTLSSMTGIQLTSADLSMTDMSGVVPLSATTVEEIHVPVFNDERLQVITPPTSTQAEATTEIFNCNNNNQSDTDQRIVDGIFEDYEFDIEDLFGTGAEKSYQQTTKTTTTTTPTATATTNKKIKEREMSQLFDNFINNNYNNYNKLIKTNNNNNYNYNNNHNNTLILKSEMGYDIMDAIDLLDNCNQKKMNKQYEEEDIFDTKDLLEPQFRLLPGALEDSQITYNDDDLEFIQQNIPEDAVCFEDEKVPDLSDVFTNSQASSLLVNGAGTGLQSHPNIIEVLKNEEPIVPDFVDDSNSDCSIIHVPCVTILPASAHVQKPTVLSIDNNPYEITTNIAEFTNLKRPAVNTNHPHKEKRSKLCLNIDQQTQQNTINNTINTPDIVNLITDWRDETIYLNSPQYSPEEVLNDFLTDFTSNTNSMHSFDNTTIPDESPVTPISNYSNSHQTNSGGSEYAITAPNSPAFSVSSNIAKSQFSSNSSQATPTRKKRGRPAKQHSDLPSPTLLRKLTEAERKHLEDRAKNNEASRLSRQKHNQRKLEEIEMEKELQLLNDKLNQEAAYKKKVKQKLMKALEKKYLAT